ncbi:MAG TPA: MerR family DNA-binding transcriptional regulator [Baekduia sp.]|nr:MerR family DNA-binding transcriptional regulator [Baekduia sp.]
MTTPSHPALSARYDTRVGARQEAAVASGLTPHTLRYYERSGLLDPTSRASPS